MKTSNFWDLARKHFSEGELGQMRSEVRAEIINELRIENARLRAALGDAAWSFNLMGAKDLEAKARAALGKSRLL